MDRRTQWIASIAFFLLVCVVGWIVSKAIEEPTITMRGEVILSNPRAAGINAGTCRTYADFVIVNAVSNGAEKFELKNGAKQADGSCLFTFTLEVPVADRYVFTLSGRNLPERSLQRSMIDVNGPTGVELEVTIRW